MFNVISTEQDRLRTPIPLLCKRTATYANTGNQHAWFGQWEQKGDPVIRYFLEPTHLTVNYALHELGCEAGGREKADPDQDDIDNLTSAARLSLFCRQNCCNGGGSDTPELNRVGPGTRKCT